MAKIDRQKVYDLYNKHCGYCGKELVSIKEMQVDHIHPQCLKIQSYHSIKDINDPKNLMPSCRRCNHYKRGDTLEQFRNKMKTLHERIESNYINKVAIDFGIIKMGSFDGIFYFEKQNTI